jgi:hypothetical protein
VSLKIAVAVGRRAAELGLATKPVGPDFEAEVKMSMYDPRY